MFARRLPDCSTPRLTPSSFLLRSLIWPVLLCAGLPSYASEVDLLAGIDKGPMLSQQELAEQRGGFMLANGALVNFGLEIKQFANNNLVNKVNFDLVKPHFTVTQTTNGNTTTTELASLPPGGISFTTGALNNGATKMAVNLTSQSIQSVVQNAADNQALTSVTTLNLSTQGLANTLHQGLAAAQLLHSLQLNNWAHH